MKLDDDVNIRGRKVKRIFVIMACIVAAGLLAWALGWVS